MKKLVVISLGGSLIVPEKQDLKFLEKFKKTLQKNYSKYKFVVVTGGGSVARKYISILRAEKKSAREMSLAGIRATRMNAQILMQIFGKEANDKLVKSMKEIKSNLRKNNVVICGALRYTKNSTSDSTAAFIANYLKADFINLTNVKGLYDKNPSKCKNAKFISLISWGDFEKMAFSKKFKAGQHFVLDQNAASVIKRYRIRTYIIGDDLRNLDRVLKGGKFVGTIIGN